MGRGSGGEGRGGGGGERRGRGGPAFLSHCGACEAGTGQAVGRPLPSSARSPPPMALVSGEPGPRSLMAAFPGCPPAAASEAPGLSGCGVWSPGFWAVTLAGVCQWPVWKPGACVTLWDGREAAKALGPSAASCRGRYGPPLLPTPSQRMLHADVCPAGKVSRGWQLCPEPPGMRGGRAGPSIWKDSPGGAAQRPSALLVFSFSSRRAEERGPWGGAGTRRPLSSLRPVLCSARGQALPRQGPQKPPPPRPPRPASSRRWMRPSSWEDGSQAQACRGRSRGPGMPLLEAGQHPESRQPRRRP